MIAAPPLSAGALHDKITEPLPGVAASPVAAPGSAAGTAATPALDEPVPATLVALTRYKYVVPFVRPESPYVTSATAAATVLHVTPPFDERSTL